MSKNWFLILKDLNFPHSTLPSDMNMKSEKETLGYVYEVYCVSSSSQISPETVFVQDTTVKGRNSKSKE